MNMRNRERFCLLLASLFCSFGCTESPTDVEGYWINRRSDPDTLIKIDNSYFSMRIKNTGDSYDRYIHDSVLNCLIIYRTDVNEDTIWWSRVYYSAVARDSMFFCGYGIRRTFYRTEQPEIEDLLNEWDSEFKSVIVDSITP